MFRKYESQGLFVEILHKYLVCAARTNSQHELQCQNVLHTHTHIHTRPNVTLEH